MSIILNGASYRCVWWWTRHFGDEVENVRTEIVKSEGLASEEIRDKMLEMQLMAEGTRCKNFMWIADLSPSPGVSRRFSAEEWERARQIAEKFRGLEGQPYFVIEQEKADGRIHRHAIWSRVDAETGRARPDGWDSEICHAASKAICQELGLQPVPSPFDKDREGERPKRAPKRWEMYRGMKSGLDPRVITAEVTELFHQSDSGKAFHAALEQHGYTLVKGDRRGWVILDSAGDDHSLARRIEGVNTKELNVFMRDVDHEALPTVEQGRALHQERKIAALEADRATIQDEIKWEQALDRAGIEKEERERKFTEPVGQQEKEQGAKAQEQERTQTAPPELGKAAGEIRLAYSLTQTGQEFANALEDRGFILSHVTKDDAERLNRWERQRLKELEALAPAAEKQQTAKRKQPRRSRADTWMAQTGGVEHLPPELLQKAQASYDRWWGNKEKYSFASYVAFVQEKEREDPKHEDQVRLYEKYKAGELVVINSSCQVYQLTNANTGDDAKGRAEHLKDIDRAPLLSATAAESLMRTLGHHRYEEQERQRREEWLEKQPLSKTAGEIRLAYSLTHTGQEFLNAIEDRGYILASITDADAERLNRWERQRLKEERPLDTTVPGQEPAPRFTKYQAGQLAVINQYGQVFQLTQQNTGHDPIARGERLKDIDPAALLSVTAAQGVMREVQQHRQEERQHDRERKYEEYLREAGERHWPTMPPQPERKAPGLFAEAADQASRDERVANLKGPAAQVWKLWTRIDRDKHGGKIAEGVPFSVATDEKAFAAALDAKGIGFAMATKEEAERSHRQAELAKAAGNYAPRFREGEIVLVTAPRPEFRRGGEIIAPTRVQKIDPSLAEKFTAALGNRRELKDIEATKEALVERARTRAGEWEATRLKNATKSRGRRGGRTDLPAAPDLAKAGSAIIGGALGILGKFGDGLSLEGLTPKEKYEAAKRDHANEREADRNADFDAYMAGLAEARQQDHQRDAERERQRERERDR